MSRNISMESVKADFGCLNYFSDIRNILLTCEVLTENKSIKYNNNIKSNELD